MLAMIFGLMLANAVEIESKNLDYSVAGTTMQGYLSEIPTKSALSPGILIVHDWMGLRDYAKQKSEQLAKMGYVALAVDIYGKGIRPNTPKEAAELAGKYKNDRNQLRSRIRAAYAALVARPNVDKTKIIIIGYCFGGTTALELARSGAPLAGTVSFHGGLSSPTPQDAKNIKGKVLVLHGADDPNVPPEEVEAFKKEMKDANVTMKFVAYPGAVHAFTNPKAGNDVKKGAAYNAEADKKSWQEFEKFLHEI